MTTAIADSRSSRPGHPTRTTAARVLLAARVALVLLAIAAAYHVSLGTLVADIGVDTPLAYLGLVPFIALLLAAAVAASKRDEPAIHDRQLDYIVGVPLMLVAVAVVYTLPARMSTLFWAWRIDLLSLPLFVVGVVSVTFGLRTMWRLRAALAFLLLAWPVPYALFVDNWLGRFTDVTVAALRHVIAVVPVATVAPSADNSLFAVVHGGKTFVLSVASACAGVNGAVGFVLVGVAAAAMVKGRPALKLLWLAVGMVLLWTVNLGRLLLVLAAGHWWGEKFAMEAVHPYIGLVTFSLGVLAMIALMPVFRLTGQTRASAAVTPAGPAPAPAVAAHPGPAVPRAWFAVLLVLMVSLVLAVGNTGLRRYRLVADELGATRLAAFTEQQATVPGWIVSKSGQFEWTRRYFGAKSTWNRYRYQAVGLLSPFRTTAPVVADVISATRLQPFSTYGLESCYRFHGYKIHDIHTVDLGGGIIGTVVSYYNTKAKADWTTLYWHWKVNTTHGARYERVVLMMTNTFNAEVQSPPVEPSLATRLGLSVENASHRRGDGYVDAKMARTRQFLVGFGQAVVSGQASLSKTPAAHLSALGTGR